MEGTMNDTVETTYHGVHHGMPACQYVDHVGDRGPGRFHRPLDRVCKLGATRVGQVATQASYLENSDIV